MRIIKNPEERKKEIFDAAEILFVTKGYPKTTIDDILKVIGIAKGTFYYYFKSKEEIMDAIVMRFIASGVLEAKAIAADPNLTVHEKFMMIIMSQKPEGSNKEQMIVQLHLVNNAQMHLKSVVESVLQLSPVLTEVLEQGINEHIMHTPYPREAIDLILVSSSFLFDESIFKWHPDEVDRKIQSFIYMVEVILGAETGSFSFLSAIMKPV